MSNLPKFLIAENGMAEPEGEYVVDNMLQFFGGDAQKVAGLMRRLGDWYVAYKSGK